ncbi:MAG TPA: TIGR02466 family protein [Beijerinckiaceae bacterium]|jgi:uncharacterized protein (TIGR02466 family)
MASIDTLFVTRLYRTELDETGAGALVQELDAACRSVAEDDVAGQRWSRKNGYPGYTSYASLDDLPWRFPVFKQLHKALDQHVAAFAKACDFELKGAKLRLDSLWINVLPPGGTHSAHIHPHSVVSGTIYVAVPEGAGAIRFEDPRLGLMMAAPPRKAKAAPDNRSFVTVTPKAGTVLLWESWLRHDVPVNQADEDRISVSFNYAWRE